MFAAVAFRPAVSRPVRPCRRLDQPYPLFGFHTGTYWLPSFDRQADIHAWLLRQDRSVPGEAWPARWQRCSSEHPQWFKQVWVVHLPRRSRWLAPGSYVFDPLTDFLHIPGSPPAVVQDCYEQAFAELPRHRFIYLDLLWEPTANGRTLLSPSTLRARLVEQELQYKRRLRHDRLLIEAARARQREAFRQLGQRRVNASEINLASTPLEARRILGMSSAALEQSMQSQIAELQLAKFDPMIVFEEPALLERAGGNMPLGLVAHWD